MEETRRKLLEQIAGGVTIFEPSRRTSQGLTEFQALAGRLLAMEREGLINRCVTHRGEIAGQEFYDEVIVMRGLTAAGRAALDNAQAAISPAPPAAADVTGKEG